MVPRFGLRNGLLTHTVNAQTPRLLGLLWRVNSVQTKIQKNLTGLSEIGLFDNSCHSPPRVVYLPVTKKMVFYQKFFALNSR